MNNIEQRIEYTLDFIDYGKIHSVMEALDWSWYGSVFGIPEAWELRQAARNMLTRVVKVAKTKGEAVTFETGGFRAEYDPTQDYMSIMFILESSDDQFFSEDHFDTDSADVVDLRLVEKTTADIIQLDLDK